MSGQGRLRVPTPAGFVEPAADAAERSVAAVFERQVAQQGDRLAVRAEDAALTYRELNDAANRVAHAILDRFPWRPQLAAGGGDISYWETHAEPIAVLIGQGAAAVAGALAVFKAGKLYVPLEPSDPASRLSFILKHLPARVVLVNDRTETIARSLAPADCAIVKLDRLDRPSGAANPGLEIPPHAPAYLVYTSGSTGRPKGVLHTQGDLLNDIAVKTSVQRLTSNDRLCVLGWGTANALKVVMTAMLNGASLHPFHVRRHGLVRFAEWMIRERITVQTISAPIYRSFVALLRGDEGFPDLRLIRAASDTVYPGDIASFRRHFGDRCYYLNALSSSETGTVCTYAMDKATAIDEAGVPVGFPVEGCEVRLLDEAGAPVRAGEPGTLAVRSRWLALGYWRQPELTRTAFQCDPDDPGLRTFVSGDLARLRPDGALVHAGRNDAQVKIRGLRVEIAEVEGALMAHENVKAAAVAATWEGEGREKRLAAYVVPHRAPVPTTSALRRFLEPRLASHMIPAAFVPLEAMPLLPSGKIDRRALPAPGRARPVLDQAFTPPRTELEERLADLWSQVLGLDRIGLHDAFLDLGGDSLRASQLLARAIEAFGVELPLRAMFESSTVAKMAVAIEERRPAFAAGRGAPRISRQPGHGPWQLSFGQERLWFLNQLDPGSTAYNMPKLIRIGGELQVPALREALEVIVGRHEVLRTRYHSRDGRPEAVVSEATTIELPLHDLEHLPPGERETEMQRRSAVEAARPFDLQREVMLRCALFRLGANEHVLLCVTHHIASDGWSRGLLLRELAAHYAAIVAGGPPSLPALPIQYHDFAHEQRRQWDTPEMAAQLAYWTRCLHDLPGALHLPADRPRPAAPSSRGAGYVFTYAQARALGELARQEGVTLFMLLLAAFKALLARYTRDEDIVVGCPVAGRAAAETEDLVGFFVNMLVLRTDLSGDPTFRELLGRVRERALGAYAHSGVPFEKLVEHLQPARDLNRNPLFQVSFDVHTPRHEGLRAGGMRLASVDAPRENAPFDQAWNVAVVGDELRIRVEYNADLFDTATVGRMSAHFRTLLDGVLTDPAATVSQLPLLTASERRQLLINWNESQTAYPIDKTIAELFEQQVALTPDNPAVAFEDRTLTYTELNIRANQLAHHLIVLGVGPDVLVGICVERSLEMVVALLGILKSGGAYLPLDPAYPKERLAFMLEDSQAQVLITERKLEDALPEHAKCVLIDQAEALDRYPVTHPKTAVTPDNLAYVIYTSGSTGRPKGACVPHRALTNLLYAMRDETAMTGNDALLAVTTLSFDIAALELYLPLITGARLVLASRQDAADGARLAKHWRDSGATLMQATPATWRLLLESGWQGSASLKLLCGGEALSIDLADRLLERSLSLTNLYGPTETTIWSTAHRVAAGKRAIPLGRPLANTQVYILDPDLNPTPIGVPGELHIGGAGLARGYLNRPELTQEKFIPNPFSENKSSRLYKTGDLARYFADGNIEFLGRLDHQVKIRGFRIELGEIEAVLNQRADVKACAVVAREDTPGDKRLVAYVVAAEISPNPPFSKGGVMPSSLPLANPPLEKGGRGDLKHGNGASKKEGLLDLTSHLKAKLPDYMLPTAFVLLEALPLTPNGKLDRKALPAPEYQSQEVYVAPRTPTEQTLVNIYAEVLKVDRVGIHDNFFDLGGHSLLATQVISRIRQAFNIELPLRALFDTPWIAELAVKVAGALMNAVSEDEMAGLLADVEGFSLDEIAADVESTSSESQD